jgi:hypothetical protein
MFCWPCRCQSIWPAAPAAFARFFFPLLRKSSSAETRIITATTKAATAMITGLPKIWLINASLSISLMLFTSLHCRSANAAVSCARSYNGREMPHPYNRIYRNSKRTSTLPKRSMSPSLRVRSSCGVKITPFNRVLFRALRSSTVYCPCWLRT